MQNDLQLCGPDESPAWLQRGRTQFQNEHGGPAETAKGVLTQNSLLSYAPDDYVRAANVFAAGITPESVRQWTCKYDEALLEKMQALGKDLIQVTWSCGFSNKAEIIQQEIVRQFTQKAHRRGIKICAYLSLRNIFWTNAFKDEPFLKDVVARFSNGDPVLYGHCRLRYLACINQAAWVEYLKAKMAAAIKEAEVDGVYFDNLAAPCACPTCARLFADFTERCVGEQLSLPPLFQSYPVKSEERREMEVKLAEARQQEGLKVETSISRDYLHRRFLAYRVASVLTALRQAAFAVKKPLLFAANNHLEPYINDTCNVIYSQDTSMPGPDHTNIPVLRYLTADADGWKQVVTNHQCAGRDPRLSMAEAFAFQSYPYEITWPAYNLFYKAHPELFADMEPVAKIGVLLEYPKRRPNYLQPLGWANLLYEVIIPDKWDRVELSKFKVILVPDPEAVGDDLLAALRIFEQNGGVLITTGSGFGFDAFARRRSEAAIPQIPDPLDACLSDRIVERLKTSAAPHYVSLQAPRGVVVNLAQKNNQNTWILHVLNYNNQPVPELTIQCRWPGLKGQRAVCHSPDDAASRPLLFEAGGRLRLTNLQVYAVVAIG